MESERIPYEDLADHDLLVLCARSCNQTEKHLASLNTKTAKQDIRITKVESFVKYVKWCGGIGGGGSGLALGILKLIGIY